MTWLKRVVKAKLQPVLVPLLFLPRTWMKRIVLWSGTLLAFLVLFIGGLSGSLAFLMTLGGPKRMGIGLLWLWGVAIATGGAGGRALFLLWTRLWPASEQEVLEMLYTPEVRSRLESVEESRSDPERGPAGGPSSDPSDSAVQPPRESASRPAPVDTADPEEDSGGFWARWWGDGRSEAGRTRCENCYSEVAPSASECPACGSDLGAGWL